MLKTFMKLFIALSFLLWSSNSNSQTYSRVISDSEIISFIKNDIKTEQINVIASKLYPLYLDDFFYKDSADFNKKNNSISPKYSNFLFRHWRNNRYKDISYNLDSIFSREDINFFKTQIKGLKKRTHWETEFEGVTFDDNPSLDSTNHTKATVFYYSIPLFSLDKTKVIIIKGFFCGLLCGGGSYNLYIKQGQSSWLLFKKMNTWAE